MPPASLQPMFTCGHNVDSTWCEPPWKDLLSVTERAVNDCHFWSHPMIWPFIIWELSTANTAESLVFWEAEAQERRNHWVFPPPTGKTQKSGDSIEWKTGADIGKRDLPCGMSKHIIYLSSVEIWLVSFWRWEVSKFWDGRKNGPGLNPLRP